RSCLAVVIEIGAQPWEVDVVVWSPDKPRNGPSGLTGLIGLLCGRAADGWQFLTMVKDMRDAGPLDFQRPVQHPPAP
ncbi:MAG: hypothetical protein JWM72_14, partial [Actinomycetia bacterium]|nr:hypothetical protein [Actinomycetes bacterium]